MVVAAMLVRQDVKRCYSTYCVDMHSRRSGDETIPSRATACLWRAVSAVGCSGARDRQADLSILTVDIRAEECSLPKFCRVRKFAQEVSAVADIQKLAEVRIFRMLE